MKDNLFRVGDMEEAATLGVVWSIRESSLMTASRGKEKLNLARIHLKDASILIEEC